MKAKVYKMAVRPAVIWVGNGGTHEKTGGRAGCGRVKDVKICVRSDEDGQDRNEYIINLTCAEERCWEYWKKEDGATRQEEERKTQKEVYGHDERGHACSWWDVVTAVVKKNPCWQGPRGG